MYRFEIRTLATNFPVYILEWEKLLNSRMHKNMLATLEDAYCAENTSIVGLLYNNNKAIARYEYFGNGCYIIHRYDVPTTNAYAYIHRGF